MRDLRGHRGLNIHTGDSSVKKGPMTYALIHRVHWTRRSSSILGWRALGLGSAATSVGKVGTLLGSLMVCLGPTNRGRLRDEGSFADNRGGVLWVCGQSR